MDNVLVDKEVQMASLNTAWESTKLHIDLTTEDSGREDYDFSISGFKHSNIVFNTRVDSTALNQV